MKCYVVCTYFILRINKSNAKLLIDNYDVLSGSVFICKSTELQRKVTVKLIPTLIGPKCLACIL